LNGLKKMWVLMLVTVLLLSACSSGGGGKEAASGGGGEKAKEITIWAWDKAFNVAALEQAKAIYQKENPDLKINIIENAQDAIILSCTKLPECLSRCVQRFVFDNQSFRFCRV
jgi:lactose/L-arabinose transport system substrate-binding protein